MCVNRGFSRAALLCLTIAGWFVLFSPSDAVAEQQRPNILFAFADDWGRHASAYAVIDGAGTVNDAISTPHFDRIANEGVLFRSAFVSAPSCTPCRSALMSGQHFWRAGSASILLGAKWNERLPAFPLLLHDAGYHIGQTYKVWSPGRPVDAPFGGKRFAYEKAGPNANRFSQFVSNAVSQGKALDGAKDQLFRHVLANFDDFLQDRKADQPFFYFFGPTNVHRKWTKGSGKDLWDIDPDSLKGRMPPFLPDVPEVRQDLADYFGESQAFDEMLGVLLKRLRRTGELENTIIIVSGDHGAPGFPHGKCNLYDFGVGVPLAIRWGQAVGGRVVDDLTSLTDIAPTLLEAAGVSIPESMTGRSLLPILKADGSGVVDAGRDAVFVGRERHVDTARPDFKPYPQRAIRTHDYLFIINFRPDRYPLGDPFRLDGTDPPTMEQLTENTRATLHDEDAGPTKAWLVSKRNDPEWRALYDHAYGKRPREELFDLREDPYQMHNVASDPKYREVRTELRQRLMSELERTGDPRLIDDGAFFENPPMASRAK
jgi:N-sulfoglucosamine sulfohydrolase